MLEEQLCEVEGAHLPKVNGQPLTHLPDDLYIPPEALTIFLETFEGPLDLLLYLIKKNNLDILDIPISEVTRQYMHYIGLMKQYQIELAAEYLVMAAMLAEIKSRLLLPRVNHEEEEEQDPRAELIRRLQEYERYRNAATQLEEMPQVGRDLYPVSVKAENIVLSKAEPEVELITLLQAMQSVLLRSEQLAHHQIVTEPLSVRERMSLILEQLTTNRFVEFSALFTLEEGRAGVVVSFLAILELVKETLVEIVQTEPFAPIHVRVIDS